MITCELATQLLCKANFKVKDIKLIPEGSNHKVFIVTLNDDSKVICKFPIQRHTEDGITEKHTDTLFGGELSLKRESALYTLARVSGQVPAPLVYSLCNVDEYDFIVLELMKGKSFREYVSENNYSVDTFLRSIERLGQDFAKIQNFQFKSFGNIISETSIEPSNIDNFADRFSSIINNRIDKANTKGVFTSSELNLVNKYFTSKIDSFRPYLDIKSKPPVMIFTDMHADNYFVDAHGIPSGYFDLESSQAAPAELEFYGFRFFLFNYFDKETMIKAESKFFKAYKNAGGKYAPETQVDHELIDFLSACRLLELAESYWGYIDGLRDNWAIKIKLILLNYILYNDLDYIALADIFREKTLQPKHPQL